ncbi:hypothetical protein BDE02_16G036900 [Populus trichocarpa]|nr:hypothetical protein BDE02_16G036900 [Populus trichocarpa]
MREIVVDLSPYEVEAITLQVIQQSTSLDLGWEDNSPIIWEPIDFLRELSDINLRLISPTLADLLDLKTLDLHNTSLAGEIQNLEGLQHLEKLYARITCWQQFSTEKEVLSSLCCSQ